MLVRWNIPVSTGYFICSSCGKQFHNRCVEFIVSRNLGDFYPVCPDCFERYESEEG